MEPTLYLHEFFVEGGNPQKSHVLLNITEPATPEEKSKGYFFAICEIDNAENKYITKLQNIIDEIENSYYEIPDQEDKTSLEIILDKINKESFSLLKPDIALHCIVGAIREKDIIFAFYGQPQMLLFYPLAGSSPAPWSKNKETLYKKMDLVAENQNAEEQNEKRLLFSQIILGKIGPQDYLFAGTPHLINYFNHDRLQKIITTRPPRQSAEHLQRVLAELKNNISFGGIIIHLQKHTEVYETKNRPRKGDSLKSLTSLFHTEQNTASILSPSFLPRLQNKISGILRKKDAFTKKETEQPKEKNYYAGAQISSPRLKPHHPQKAKEKTFSLPETLSAAGRLSWFLIKNIGQGLWWVINIIIAFIGNAAQNLLLLFFVISNYQNRRQNILADWQRRFNNFKENIKRLPPITKILFSASILLGLIFVISLVYLKINQNKAMAAQAYAEAMQTIKNKKDSAESSLIYNDSNAAFVSLKEAKQILNQLSCRSAQQKNECKNLKTQLDTLLTKIRKLVVAKPQLIADWSEMLGTNTVQKIMNINNKIVGFGKSTADIIVYDPLTKDSKKVKPGVSADGFTGGAAPKENDYLVLLDDKNLVQFKPQDGAWKKIDIDFLNPDAKIVSIVVYNRRLYSLDAQNKQIYKHDAIKTGFARGQAWLKDAGMDLTKGIDMAIDGDIFVLSSDGKIFKFSNGQIQPFAIQNLDPELNAGNKIYTYTDLNNIYILDTANKRIIILDKNGQLKSQITAEEFAQPTGMVVEEAKNTAYILDSNKLYQLNLQ